MRSRLVRSLLPLLFSGLLIPAPVRADASLARASVRLDVAALYVDEGGIHPLNGASDVTRSLDGAFYQTLRLGPDEDVVIVFRLSYRMAGPDRVDLELTTRFADENRAAPPPLHARIGVLDCWTTTLLEDDGTGGRVLLRVVPILRPAVQDEPLEGHSFPMRLSGGPLILYGGDRGNDTVIFREVNANGEGITLGLAGIGTFKISPARFADARPCGWVRGHRWEAELAGHSLGGWSVTEILPEDPDRPGAGWLVYGRFEEDPTLKRGFYGGFRPEGD